LYSGPRSCNVTFLALGLSKIAINYGPNNQFGFDAIPVPVPQSKGVTDV